MVIFFVMNGIPASGPVHRILADIGLVGWAVGFVGAIVYVVSYFFDKFQRDR